MHRPWECVFAFGKNALSTIAFPRGVIVASRHWSSAFFVRGCFIAATHFYFPRKGVVRKKKERYGKMKKCDFCGEYYDDAYEGTLDNGSPACPDCVEREGERAKEKQEGKE